ncbi:MarR family winged helix-turn-helix transcriptional regulator [Aeromicrobium chenweiae]|uniref:MarR family transcriptional regulator n=1 Tax=Aeromicrobium chenweiae TaxID=2079793 RepID=A0A2S0WHE7_9ACTN|nr:MarR family winged helix-turn-helix transcriptional regulator [Aeromicrobium chenweiae]AWB90759.1 MarR family transcriptional regulator [Aeromicrobium chenweiae]TGN31020.1 MarR family transcriptional regulator [Aeromicrobium chenweiae]
MTETRVGPPEQAGAPIDLGQALSALLRRYLAGARDVVDDLPGGPRGYQVMSVAFEGLCGNQATIAQRLGIDRTVMTYLLDDLEQAGMVERRPDPADRRARQVVLTPRGESVLAEVSGRLQDIEREVLGGLVEADAEMFRQLLDRAVADAPLEHSTCEESDVPAC